jgi:hypothetical protein
MLGKPTGSDLSCLALPSFSYLIRNFGKHIVLLVGFLPDLFFDTEDVGDMFLLNFGCLSTNYTALNPTRQNTS